MNTFENEIMPAKTMNDEENNVIDLVKFHTDLLDECLATSNRIRIFIKAEHNDKSPNSGAGADCMIDELTNQSAKLEDLRKVLYSICSILGC